MGRANHRCAHGHRRCLPRGLRPQAPVPAPQPRRSPPPQGGPSRSRAGVPSAPTSNRRRTASPSDAANGLTERRRSRTDRAWGCHTAQVLKSWLSRAAVPVAAPVSGLDALLATFLATLEIRPCMTWAARASRCELTQSCPMRRRRPRLPWPMRARCRSTPGTRWIPSCHLAGAYSTAYPCRRRGLRRARDPLRERLVPHSASLSRAASPLSGARGPLDGVNLCAQMGLSLQTSRSNPPPV